MKADRTVIVFGVFLFLVGLAIAWNGYGFVQVERGWTLVISGTVGFCSGLILIALGLVLRELEAISSSAAKAALFLAKARSDAQWSPPPAAPAQPAEPAAPDELLEPHLPFEPQPAAVADEAVKEEVSSPVAAEAPMVEEPPKAEPTPAPTERPAPKPPGWMSRAGSYVASFGAAKGKEAPASETKPTIETSNGWLEKAIADHAATQEGHKSAAAVEFEHHGAQEPEHAAEPAEEPAPFPFGPEIQFEPESPVKLEPHVEPEPHAEAEAESETPLASQPEPDQKPMVVGRYEAHGARYTMYADGSIEAETAHGVYRFASMDELKRFIEDSA